MLFIYPASARYEIRDYSNVLPDIPDGKKKYKQGKQKVKKKKQLVLKQLSWSKQLLHQLKNAPKNCYSFHTCLIEKSNNQQEENGSDLEASVTQKVWFSIMVTDFNFQKKMQLLQPNGNNFCINFLSDK